MDWRKASGQAGALAGGRTVAGVGLAAIGRGRFVARARQRPADRVARHHSAAGVASRACRPPMASPDTVTRPPLPAMWAGPLMVAPPSVTSPTLPMRLTTPVTVSAGHGVPLAPPSSTGPAAPVTDAGPLTVEPHTATLAGRPADSGPPSVEAWMDTTAPAAIVRGPEMVAWSRQVTPAPMVSGRLWVPVTLVADPPTVIDRLAVAVAPAEPAACTVKSNVPASTGTGDHPGRAQRQPRRQPPVGEGPGVRRSAAADGEHRHGVPGAQHRIRQAGRGRRYRASYDSSVTRLLPVSRTRAFLDASAPTPCGKTGPVNGGMTLAMRPGRVDCWPARSRPLPATLWS